MLLAIHIAKVPRTVFSKKSKDSRSIDTAILAMRLLHHGMGGEFSSSGHCTKTRFDDMDTSNAQTQLQSVISKASLGLYTLSVWMLMECI